MENIKRKSCSSDKDFRQKMALQARASKRRKRKEFAKKSKKINRS